MNSRPALPSNGAPGERQRAYKQCMSLGKKIQSTYHENNLSISLEFIDKALLSMDGSIGGLFLLVKGYYASKSRGWRCDWEREVERRPPF